MHTHFEAELSRVCTEQRNDGKVRGKGGGNAAANEKNRRAAMHDTLVAELFSLCEREVPNQSEPFHTGENKFRSAEGRDLDRKDLPQCTPVERSVLDHAGTVVKGFLESIQTADYRVLSTERAR